MNKRSGLGRGFDTLIPQNFTPDILLEEDERVQKLFISDIEPNRDQPRKYFDEQALSELADSIRQYGILQPLVVTPRGGGKYQLVAGERRWRAAQLAGLETVPAIVRTSKELEQLEIAIVENVQRVDLSPLEQAVSIQRLHDQFNLSYETIAQRLGKAVPTVNNIVRLLQLPKAAQEALQQGEISEGHARSILALRDDPGKQTELLALIKKHRWSVRQAEQFVTAQKAGAKTARAAREKIRTTTPATEKLSKQLSAPVSIRRTAKGGKLEIGFKSDDELEALVKKISETLR